VIARLEEQRKSNAKKSAEGIQKQRQAFFASFEKFL
jgi:hypothetical protein